MTVIEELDVALAAVVEALEAASEDLNAAAAGCREASDAAASAANDAAEAGKRLAQALDAAHRGLQPWPWVGDSNAQERKP